jgi:cation:H+ antiporter
MPLANAVDYPIWINALIFLVAAGLVWFAGVRLVHALDVIAKKTGLSQAFAGMLLLGTITSLPEIANVATASAYGNPALGINNLLGSASINIVLLAAVDAVVGRDALTSVVSRPATLMQAALCMLVLALVAVAVTVGDVAIFGIGIWGFVICAASIGAFWFSGHYSQHGSWEPVEHFGDRDDEDQSDEDEDKPLRPLVVRTVIAAAVIFFAGYSLSQTGDALAEQTGLGAGLTGFLLIGFATSMPELSTITAALRLRRHEMAIGEVLGTNFVNIALFLLADVVFLGDAVINQLGPFEAVSALLGVLLTGIILVGLLERRNRTIFRMGYDSAAVLAVFAIGAAVLYAVR